MQKRKNDDTGTSHLVLSRRASDLLIPGHPAIEPTVRHFKTVFESTPGLYLLLKPDPDFTIVAVNNAYLEATMKNREELLGHPLFEIFPDNPADPHTAGLRNLRASLHRVLRNRITDTMPAQKFDIRSPQNRGSRFQERYWNTVNVPVFGPEGPVIYIIHCLEDVAPFRTANEALQERHRQVADDFATVQTLHKIALRSTVPCDQHALLLDVLNAAIEVTCAQKGTLQLLNSENRSLRIVASRGFSEDWLSFFNNAGALSHSACGRAVGDGVRVIVEDVATSPIFAQSEALKVQLAAGVRAVQSTPLISRSGQTVGVLSTHFTAPHRPAKRELYWMDLLAQQAANLVEQTRAADALRESENRFRSFANDTPMIIWMADRDASITYANRALLDLSGVATLDAFTGKVWERMVHSEDLPRVYAAYSEAVRLGQPYTIEFRYRQASTGEFRWHVVKGLPRFIGNQLSGFIGTGVDIHDRKLAEEEARRSGERYRTLFNSIDEGFCVIQVMLDDAARPIDYRFVEVNPAFEKHTGLRNAQGKTIRQLIPLHEQQWVDVYAQVALTGQSARFQKEAKQLGRWYDVFAFPFGDPAERQVAVLFYDITDRKRIHDQLEHAVNERTAALRSTIADLEGFSYSIAHDMRAPLRAMHSFAQLALSEHNPEISETVKGYLQRIRSASHRLDQFIRDILDYSQVVRREIRLEPTPVEPLIHDIIQSYPALTQHAASIETVGPFADVLANPAALTQVISNLLDNALKFVGPGVTPKIRIWAETAPDLVRLWFQDNGIGIAPESHERIFAIFERLNRADLYEGTGIGLAVVKKAVERMGGRVGLESEPGKGSRFFIELRSAMHPADDSLT